MKKSFFFLAGLAIIIVFVIVAVQKPQTAIAIVMPFTGTPSPDPSVTPSPLPSLTPSPMPTITPSAIPTNTSTAVPTVVPTDVPTAFPTTLPTAIPTIAPLPVLDEGNWNIGTEFTLDLTSNPAPTWLQLLSRGDVITSPARICHPFRGGQFKWVGEIRQLLDGQWVKIETETGYLNGSEGQFVACANAPVAGTYALFGYYTGPSEPAEQYSECSFEYDGFGKDFGLIDLNLPESYLKIGFDIKANLPAGTIVKYKIFDVKPAGSIDKNLTGSTKVTEIQPGYFVAFFNQKIHFTTDLNPKFWVRLEFPSLKCYKNLNFNGTIR